MASHEASSRYANEPIPVPADHQDPNYPHYPGDLEHQSATRRPILSKKGLWIAGGVLTTSVFIIAAVLWGVALTRNHDNGGAKAQEIIVTTTTTPAPHEIQTVFENATTFVYTTTRVPLLVVPSLATSTVILAPTARAEVTAEAPLRPTMVEPSSATAPTEVGTGGTLQSTKCLFDGAWALKEQCEKHCPAWDSHTTHCEVSKRSKWVCVSCPF